MFGRYFSCKGIFRVMEDSFIVNRSVLTMPSRRSVRTPSAPGNGEITRISATSVGAYSFLFGMIWASSCSTVRFGGIFPPGTQIVNSDALKRSRSSMTRAVTRYCPPCLATNSHVCALSPSDFVLQTCSSIVFSIHAFFSYAQSFKTALTSTSRSLTNCPSMSETIDSIVIFSPFCTNVRGVLMPTYKSDGCTSSEVELDHVCRFTSCTEEEAEIVYGRGGLT